MTRWLRGLWNAYRRRIDIAILWPQCVKAAHGDLEHAIGAFMFHTIHDPAWEDLNDEEVDAICCKLLRDVRPSV